MRDGSRRQQCSHVGQFWTSSVVRAPRMEKILGVCVQVVADGALAAVLRDAPLVVTLLRRELPGERAYTAAQQAGASRQPVVLGAAEIDLAPLLHAR